MPYRVDDQNIQTGLSRRHESAGPVTREALRRVATGCLRQVHAGMSDPVVGALKALLGVDENDQVAQRVVDWFLDGHRDNPPFLQRPQFRPLIRSTLTEHLGTKPSDTVVEALVDCLAGMERDLVMAPSPGARMMISGKLVDVYVEGA